MKKIAALLFAAISMVSSATAQPSSDAEQTIEEKRAAWRAAWAAVGVKDYEAPAVKMLQAEPLESFSALEATQGAAADEKYFYAVSNFVIGKYHRKTGELAGRWIGARGGPIKHLNSCYAEDGNLFCAHSNHPGLPMTSSVEIFDTKTMAHAGSKSLGMLDEGSFVWFDHYQDGWIAGFAHYDDETGLPYKDHTYASIVTYDAAWRKTGGYVLPGSILEKMAPQAASGGAIGDDGRLYVMGHDLPEMYVLEFPKMGSEMLHVATIAVPAEGQAFAFDPKSPRRVWAISRPNQKLVSFKIPAID